MKEVIEMFFVHQENNLLAGVINCFLFEFYGLMTAIIAVAVLSCTGCSGGLGQIGGFGVPSIVVHQYNYQAQPPPVAPDTPPSPPNAIVETNLPRVPLVNYKTIYESTFDPPTMVVLVNRRWWPKRVQIDDEPEFRLGPYQATANIHLPPGEHLIRETTERPTKMGGAIFDWVTFKRISVTLNGRSQVIDLNSD